MQKGQKAKDTSMGGVDTRTLPRDTIFLMADLRLEGDAATHRARVRNLSAGGMMAEAEVDVRRGSRLAVDLRNVGWVEGTVAWVQGNRFGIAFASDVDTDLVRDPLSGDTA